MKIVVFFGIDTRYRAFLKYLEESDSYHYGDFIFLASEEWATNQEILTSSPRAARGAITLKVKLEIFISCQAVPDLVKCTIKYNEL